MLPTDSGRRGRAGRREGVIKLMSSVLVVVLLQEECALLRGLPLIMARLLRILEPGVALFLRARY